MNHHYAYLIGSFIFVVVWGVLFVTRKDLRREMLTMSFVGGTLFPLALIYLPDYWYPEHVSQYPLGIEDLLFAFTIGGIGAVLYEVVLGKTHTLCDCRKQDPKNLVVILLASVTLLLTLALVFGLNSIYSSYISLLLIFAYFMYSRRDLFPQAILSGLFVGLLMFAFYQIWARLYPGVIEHWWMLQNISGILIFGTPLEEIIWGFNWGIVGGIAYEFMRGIGAKTKNR